MRIHWGNNRGTRCLEIVLALLANPARDDPIGAAIATRLRNLRTRLRESPERIIEFTRQWHARANLIGKPKRKNGPRHITGPIAGISEAADWYVAELRCLNGHVELVTRDGVRLNLVHQHGTIFKRTLVELTRQGILHRLVATRRRAGRRSHPKGLPRHITCH